MTSIAIIGRANVGKSTLFNCLAKKRKAMVSSIAGTTRDLKYAKINWSNKDFEIVDTGGFLTNQKKPLKELTRKEKKGLKKKSQTDIDKQVEEKARRALANAEIIIFLVNGREGLNPQDKEIASYLRKIKDKKIILAINKCDNPKLRELQSEFFKLGLGDPVLISAANGSGTGDLLDIVVKNIKGRTKKSEDLTKAIKVSIVGKPNVGKSSMINQLSGEEKAIVSEIAHTTREPNDMLIEYEKEKIILIDTAGIRRKARIKKNSLENIGVRMSFGTLKSSNIALFMIDLSDSISHQDLQLAKKIVESVTGVIIIGNKYDLIKNGENQLSAEEIIENIYKNFPHLSFAPIVLTSAKTGLNTKKILKLIINVSENNKIKISDNALSKFLKSLIKKQPPPKKRIGDGSRTQIRRSFITNFRQIGIKPPLFECTIGSKEKLPETYRKYILNNIRNKFGFEGVPIKLVVRYKQ